MKTTRVCLLLFSVCLCQPAIGLAQSNAKPDYYHAHKNAENYQKHLQKQQRKQEKEQVKREKALVKQHKQRTTHP